LARNHYNNAIENINIYFLRCDLSSSFALVYGKAGQVVTVNYAKGLLLMTPPWIIYVLCLIFLLPRWGFVKSLIAGVLTYMILAGIVSIVMKHLGRA